MKAIFIVAVLAVVSTGLAAEMLEIQLNGKTIRAYHLSDLAQAQKQAKDAKMKDEEAAKKKEAEDKAKDAEKEKEENEKEEATHILELRWEKQARTVMLSNLVHH